MPLTLSMPSTPIELRPRITVIGVGGAGGNAVNNMIRSQLEGVDFVVANTDAQALAHNHAPTRLQLGVGTTQGLGAGSRPDIGRAAAEEAIDQVVSAITGSHMVFIAAGMGGGTGTGAAPVIARTAREQGMLTVGVVTKPFNFEGQHRMRVAEAGINELQQHVDTLIIIPNQNLFRIANEKTTFADAFKMADDVLYSGVRGVTDLMLMPGLINLDFADIRTVMGEMGKAMMGTGEADGENRAVDAAQKAISNPLLDDVSMKGARGVLINITGGPDMTLFEVDEAANRIRDEVDQEASIIFGSTFDDTMTGRMRVSVVATGIDAGTREQEKPTVISFARGRNAAAAAPRPAAASGQARAEAVAPQPVTPEPKIVAAQPAAALSPTPTVMPVAEPATPPAPAPAPLPAPAAAPGVAQSARPAAPASVATASAPHPMTRPEGRAFIPPRPAEVGRVPETRSAPRPLPVDPMGAAALANAAGTPTSARRGFNRLFSAVTGISGRGRPETPVGAKPEPHLSTPAPRQTTPQPRLGGLETPTPQTAAAGQQDLLDIPAFLRRQAN